MNEVGNYGGLNKNDPRGPEGVALLGVPLLAVSHEGVGFEVLDTQAEPRSFLLQQIQTENSQLPLQHHAAMLPTVITD